MWYFSWVLGVGLACTFAILNAMWFEMKEDRRLSALPLPPGAGETHVPGSDA
ncbi:cytochrome bd-I oxidase subunit CydX [Aureimonas mangrovi]|uniref:cytochrome bd-I oxidase subunit CydX n=1 Tax=Aureimonas mangrovi TaxID=2758041 RepID=UPI00163DA95E|nr:cytochrome bd-I oxidase subunit CydX [Aureimonas mangrovi]